MGRDILHRLLQVGAFFEAGITASLEWGEGEAAMLSPNLWDYSQWDYVSTYLNIFGFEFEHGIPEVVLEETEQIIGAFTLSDIICDIRPHWDNRSWIEHLSWMDDREQLLAIESFRGITAALDWNDKREYPASFWDVDSWDSVVQPPEYDVPLPNGARLRRGRRVILGTLLQSCPALWKLIIRRSNSWLY